MSDTKQHRVENLSPSRVSEDPDRFQSRAAHPRDWVDGDLDNVSFYNLDFHGVILVWSDPDDEKLYVIDGHRRLRLAKRLQVPLVLVQSPEAHTAADAFAMGVFLNLSQWVFERGDGLLWSVECRRAAVERALHTGWLNPDGASAIRLYEFYPDLGRRYFSRPADYRERK
jgi:hypothetical protein